MFSKMEISAAMHKHLVVPEVICSPPGEKLNVTFQSGRLADLGNELTPKDVEAEPSLTWTAEEEQLYTLCMIDPDAPSRREPKFREWIHWLVGNIPGVDVARGEVIYSYVGSVPPKGSGLHRYVILVFKQPGHIDFDEPRIPKNSPAQRSRFSVRKFAKKYHLGPPVAGNFYLAQWDENVSILKKKLTLK